MEGRCDHEYYREHGYPEYCPYDTGHRPCPNYKRTARPEEERHRTGRRSRASEAEEIPYRADVSKSMESPRDRRAEREEVMDYGMAVKEYMKDYIDEETCENGEKRREDEFDPRMSKEYWYRKYMEVKRLYDACALRRGRPRRARAARRGRRIRKYT